jgi:hypothetical protein
MLPRQNPVRKITRGFESKCDTGTRQGRRTSAFGIYSDNIRLKFHLQDANRASQKNASGDWRVRESERPAATHTGRGVLVYTRTANHKPLMKLLSGPTISSALVDVIDCDRAGRLISA